MLVDRRVLCSWQERSMARKILVKLANAAEKLVSSASARSAVAMC